MAVQTTNNKPINPRGNDQSPKGYNRAALYSGKALDFDGVNDKVDCGTLDITDYTGISVSMYFNADTVTSVQILFSLLHSGGDDIRLVAESNGFTYAIDDGTLYQFATPINANEWYFAVLTFDGSTLKGYLNGQEVGSIAASFDFSTADGKLILGERFNGTFDYDGEISNTRVFNTALTAAQVSDLYNNPEKIVPTGVEDTALKLWLPMMEGAGTTAYNGAPDALGLELVTNGTFDTDSDWTKDTGWTIGSGKATRSGASTNSFIGQDFDVVSGTTYMLKYDRTYISGGGETNCFSYFEGNVSRTTRGIYTSTIQETVTVVDTFTPTHSGNLAFRLYGIGTFEGSIDNIEIKPISGIGTISGATWTHGIGAPVSQTSVIDWNKIQARTNGGSLNQILIPQGLTAGRDLLGNLFENVRKQGALNLDGNSWAEVHDNASLDITDEITLECWFYDTDEGAFEGVIGKWKDSTQRTYAIIKNNGSNNFLIRVSTDGSAQAGPTITNTDYGWIHLVLTYDGANVKGYKNGVYQSQSPLTGSIATNDLPVEIGRYGQSTGSQYNNQIAQPRIYNRALTAEEVQRNYDAGKNIYTNS